MSNKSKTLLLNLASLNCNSLVKSNSLTKQSSYLRYLHLMKYDLFAFQETHVTNMNQELINMQLQPLHSLWTYHCGLVSYSTNFMLSHNLLSHLDRAILSKITHPNNLYTPFYVLVLYAPASSNSERRQFFDTVLNDIFDSSLDIDFSRLIIMGDFNYSYQRSNLSYSTSIQWTSFLQDNFHNVMKRDDYVDLPTFRRNDNTLSTIDYIFVGTSFFSRINDVGIDRLCAEWTDRHVLHASIKVGLIRSGPGLWRANPILLQIPDFRCQLYSHLEKCLSSMPAQFSPQDQWDIVKSEVKRFVRSYAIKYTDWRTKTLKDLQRRRNRFLRNKPPLAIRLQ